MRWQWSGMPHSRAAAHRAAAPPDRSALDGGVAGAVALLSGLGLVMIYSATAPLSMGEPLPPHFLRHALALAAGVGVAALALRVPLVLWRRMALPIWGATALLLLATLLFGTEVHGARRWLRVPGLSLSFQAAELAKWATVLAVATALAPEAGRPLPRHPLRVALALTAPPVILLLVQPDFGSAAVIVSLVGLLLFAAGAPVRHLAGGAAAAVVVATTWVATTPYARARWTGFLDPWARASDEGFQLVQSFVAFGRGGAFGVGLGDGRQKLFYLPEAHTDFILAVVAEELGLAGVLVVLGGFAALIVAGGRVAARARDPFAMLVAFGMTALIAVPAAVNAAVVMGLLPTTGFPLPFLSFGANALLFCALAAGILLRIAAVEGGGGAARPRRRRRR